MHTVPVAVTINFVANNLEVFSCVLKFHTLYVQLSGFAYDLQKAKNNFTGNGESCCHPCRC